MSLPMAKILGELIAVIASASKLALLLGELRFHDDDLTETDAEEIAALLSDLVFRAVKVWRHVPTGLDQYFKLIPYGESVGLLLGPVKPDLFEENEDKTKGL